MLNGNGISTEAFKNTCQGHIRDLPLFPATDIKALYNHIGGHMMGSFGYSSPTEMKDL